MYYDRKRKKWRAQVYFTDSYGKRHRKTVDTDTRKEALRIEEEIKGKKGNAEQAKRIGNTGNSAVTLGFSWMSSSSSFAFPRMEEEDNTISTTIRKSS